MKRAFILAAIQTEERHAVLRMATEIYMSDMTVAVEARGGLKEPLAYILPGQCSTVAKHGIYNPRPLATSITWNGIFDPPRQAGTNDSRQCATVGASPVPVRVSLSQPTRGHEELWPFLVHRVPPESERATTVHAHCVGFSVGVGCP